jgi:hypothetical protein
VDNYNTDRFGGIATSAAAWNANCVDEARALLRARCKDCRYCSVYPFDEAIGFCFVEGVLDFIDPNIDQVDALCAGAFEWGR